MSVTTFVKRGLYYVGLAGLVVLIIISAISIRIYRNYDVSDKAHIMSHATRGLTLLDRHGEVFFTFDRSYPQRFVSLSEIPLPVQQAFLTAEDRGFYSHFGFSPRGIARSIYLNLKNQDRTYGGSTITQQLVKNSLLSTRKSFNRKVHEIILAAKVERTFSKDEILEMYLNSAYLGEGTFGIAQASRTYFNKDATTLSVGEASLLAGILPAPAYLSPLSGDLAAVQARQAAILDQMVQAGFITRAAKDEALRQPLALETESRALNTHAPHFALMVKRYLAQLWGEELIMRAGLRVRTTLDLNWQKEAEEDLRQHVATLRASNVSNGAVTIIDVPTGEVRAVVGSVDWREPTFGKVNMATTVRQPGSAFKPIVYATALASRTITAASTLVDRPTTFANNYRPRNFNNRWNGVVLTRRALANSLNIPAVEIIDKVGGASVVSQARRLGLTTLPDSAEYNLSTALGTAPVTLFDLTNTYATLARTGHYQSPQLVLEITDQQNETWSLPTPTRRLAIDEKVAFLVSSILADTEARRATFGNQLNLSRPVAVKTGTTQDFRDGWTVGYTPNQLAVGVWIGNNNNGPMDSVPASIGAVPLWRQLMEKFTSPLPVTEFTPPPGVVAVYVCRHNGQRAFSPHGAYLEYFIEGTEPTGYCYPPRTTPAPEPELTQVLDKEPAPKPINKPAPKPKIIEEKESPDENDDLGG